jgi:hypothetical protein
MMRRTVVAQGMMGWQVAQAMMGRQMMLHCSRWGRRRGFLRDSVTGET